MITMKTGSRAPVRFVFSDDVSETTITLQADDTSEDIAAKLRRVLELEGSVATPDAGRLVSGSLRGFIQANGLGAPSFTPADRAATEARLKAANPMGWGEGVDIESLPEH